jgi:hypothetical protein
MATQTAFTLDEQRLRRQIAASTAASTALLVADNFTEHYRGGFQSRSMWAPIVLGPAATAAAALAAVLPGRPVARAFCWRRRSPRSPPAPSVLLPLPRARGTTRPNRCSTPGTAPRPSRRCSIAPSGPSALRPRLPHGGWHRCCTGGLGHPGASVRGVEHSAAVGRDYLPVRPGRLLEPVHAGPSHRATGGVPRSALAVAHESTAPAHRAGAVVLAALRAAGTAGPVRHLPPVRRLLPAHRALQPAHRTPTRRSAADGRHRPAGAGRGASRSPWRSSASAPPAVSCCASSPTPDGGPWASRRAALEQQPRLRLRRAGHAQACLARTAHHHRGQPRRAGRERDRLSACPADGSVGSVGRCNTPTDVRCCRCGRGKS